MNSDKSATRWGLAGRYLTVLDLKTCCRLLSASVTICRCSHVSQPMRDCHESHVDKRFFPTWCPIQSKFQFSPNRRHLELDDSAPRPNAVTCEKSWLMCGKLMSRQILTRFHPDKKKKKNGSGGLSFAWKKVIFIVLSFLDLTVGKSKT